MKRFALLAVLSTGSALLAPVTQRASSALHSWQPNKNFNGESSARLTDFERSARAAGGGDRTVTIPKPLGLILDDDANGDVFVKEIVKGGNAEDTATGRSGVAPPERLRLGDGGGVDGGATGGQREPKHSEAIRPPSRPPRRRKIRRGKSRRGPELELVLEWIMAHMSQFLVQGGERLGADGGRHPEDNIVQVREEQDLLSLGVAHRLCHLVLDPAFRLLQGREGAEGVSRRGKRFSLVPSGRGFNGGKRAVWSVQNVGGRSGIPSGAERPKVRGMLVNCLQSCRARLLAMS